VKAAGFFLLAFALCLTGLSAVCSESVNVVFFRHRPWVLKFGAAQNLGRCRVRETADPSSDVLSNLIDVDADGRSDFRTVGFIDGSNATCERRAFLGFWREMSLEACRAAAAGCSQ
jgi:hypothetical protein